MIVLFHFKDQHFCPNSIWFWKLLKKKLLIKYERQRFMTSYWLSTFWCLQITSGLNPSTTSSLLEEKIKFFPKVYFTTLNISGYWKLCLILRALRHFVLVSFLKQVASCSQCRQIAGVLSGEDKGRRHGRNRAGIHLRSP